MNSDDLIAITDLPIDINAILRFVSVPAAGGIDLFLGTTRDEPSPDRRLKHLDYEAYAPMAQRVIAQTIADARARWPILRAAVVHRTGPVAPAQPSVAIAVSTAHRAESFAAAQFLIDQLKTRAPIWKRAVWSDGSADWTPGHRA